MPNPVAVPTVSTITSAFKDFGIGALGGLIFLIASQLFGGLGIIAAPLLAGSVIKGERGKTIATISGFMLLAMIALTATARTTSTNDNGGVM